MFDLFVSGYNYFAMLNPEAELELFLEIVSPVLTE